MQFALVMAGTLIRAGFGALIARGIAELVDFGIQQVLQGLFNRAAHQFAQVLLDLILINLDDFAKFLRYILAQGGLLPWLNGLCGNFHLTTLRPPLQMCEKYYTLSFDSTV
jgi:hypothetical protein